MFLTMTPPMESNTRKSKCGEVDINVDVQQSRSSGDRPDAAASTEERTAARKREKDDESVASSLGRSNDSRNPKRFCNRSNNKATVNNENSKLPSIVFIGVAASANLDHDQGKEDMDDSKMPANAPAVQVRNFELTDRARLMGNATAQQQPDAQRSNSLEMNNLVDRPTIDDSALDSSPPVLVQHAVGFQARHFRTNSRNIDLQTTFTSFTDVMETEGEPIAQHFTNRNDLLAQVSDEAGNLQLVTRQESRAVAFRARHSRTNSRNIDLQTTFTSFSDITETEPSTVSVSPAQQPEGLNEAQAYQENHPLLEQETRAVAFRARHSRTNSRNIDLQTTFTSFTDIMETEMVNHHH
ncbi:hypothetical protein MPSEU_000409200 [Mayamaea pseudoterrestris]|nr:hypothetical protein MPSEU_000409200 [Mayamaea pseudoterrestris]